MKTKLKGLLFGCTAGFLCTFLVGMMVTRNLAIEGTYTYLKLFNEVLSLVRNSYVDDVETPALIRGAWRGMLGEMDPASEYLTPEEYRTWAAYDEKRSRGADISDAGIRVARKAGMLLVVSVKPGSPAESLGITPGDRIRRIGDRPATDMSVAEAEALLAGGAGPSVFLSVARRSEPRKIEGELALERTPWGKAGYEVADAEKGVAVLRVPHFRSGMADQVRAFLGRAAAGGVGRILVDLRGNAWGDTDEAVRAASHFTGEGVVARIEERGGEGRDLRAAAGTRSWKGILVVLLDGSTAGAAELFAAALRDHADTRAVLVGEKSFGVGAEQEMLALKDGGYLRLSVRRYVSPKGTSWHAVGLDPSTTMVVTQDDLSRAQRLEKQLEQAIDHLRSLEPASARRGSEAAQLEPVRGGRVRG